MAIDVASVENDVSDLESVSAAVLPPARYAGPSDNRSERFESPYARVKNTLRSLPIVSWTASVLVVLAMWQVMAEYVFRRPSVFPTLTQIARAGLALASHGFQGQTLLTDVFASVTRIGVGFGIAVVLGTLIGFLMTVSRLFSRFVDPWLQFIRPIPPLAYIPLLIVWFGIGPTPKILTIVVGTIPVIILGTIGGAQAVPIDMVRGAQCLGASKFQVLRLVVFPSTLPEIFTAMRTGIGIAWTYLVAAELIAARSGLGWLVQNAAQSLSVSTVLAAIVLIGALGYAMDGVIRIAEYFVVPWKGKL